MTIRNLPHLGLVFHSSSKATSKQTQAARATFEKIVMVRSSNMSNGKQSYHDGDNMVHVLVANGRMYLCYTPNITKLRVVYNMLDSLDNDLTRIPRLVNANKSDILKVIKDEMVS